ncbi:F510_1955 family glycosylhydrolase [Microbacterium sp. 1P10UB]|uniref:F510_1955 family glycosylhydrolase n=1 Tax=unclassified Microbacterium TaxID=2609290 RepID=UPI0039A230A0
MRVPLRATVCLVALLTLTLTGCVAATPPTTGINHATAMPHVHAIVAAPDGEGFLLGTHDGIYSATADGRLGARVGSDNLDAMGLTALGGDLLASGHPGTRTPADLGEHNLGIIRSQDSGTTWDPVAYTGEKDFHALTASPDGTLYAQATDDNVLLVSTDRGVSWAPTGSRLQVFAIVVDTSGRVIATTADGPQVSNDRGDTFTLVPDAPTLYPLAASPDYQRLVGVDSKETIWTSSASDPIWRNVGTAHGSAQAIVITDAGDIAVVDDSGLTLLPIPAAG